MGAIKLGNLAMKADRILKDELRNYGISWDSAKATIYDARSVGVQGDERTYGYPVEIKIMHDGKPVWDDEFAERLSSRLTNEIKGINRVLCFVAEKKQ